MATRYLIDTDVLIDYLRGHPSAIAWLESLEEPPLISSITVAELFAGVREGTERHALTTFVLACDVIPVDGSIATLGGLYRRDFGKSHSVGLADAIIAASAAAMQATLVSLNSKHFPMSANVMVPYHKP